jgi:hypothetical protein
MAMLERQELARAFRAMNTDVEAVVVAEEDRRDEAERASPARRSAPRRCSTQSSQRRLILRV